MYGHVPRIASFADGCLGYALREVLINAENFQDAYVAVEKQ